MGLGPVLRRCALLARISSKNAPYFCPDTRRQYQNRRPSAYAGSEDHLNTRRAETPDQKELL
eukprot:1011250-Rhodomonas_salina.1